MILQFANRYGSFGDCVSQLATTRTLWFTETAANRVAQVTTDGDIFEYQIPTPGSQPIGIAHGPDDAVWFAELAANKVGRLSVNTVGRTVRIRGCRRPSPSRPKLSDPQ
jgi:streptogramin lyase